MTWARGSITSAKIRGDRRHPWRVSFVIGKGSERIADVHTLALGLKYRPRVA